MCKYYLNCGLYCPRKKHGGPFGNPKLHVSYTYFSLSQTNLWNKYFDVRILWCKTLFLATSPPVVSLIYLRNQPNYRPVRKPGNKWCCDLLWNWATCICFFEDSKQPWHNSSVPELHNNFDTDGVLELWSRSQTRLRHVPFGLLFCIWFRW